ncbi:transcription repressor NadR [Blautia faecis]|uniref:transcription repressor NadR n=1 Tax=Blautia faecis TaxID=871665 RepID=UPI001D072559|nr:transcription repressor NadR [Blautia faecis]MCB6582844.1 transcription repressor NadR [Blautia faecis]MCB7292866.1 transcription repressor NadR [Blautia faecis]
MKGEKRRKQLLNILSSSNNPVSGGTLSKELNVSRQIIVQDISLLRANGATIFSTNKGYLLQEDRKYSRVFKVYHTDDQVEEELSTIVDAGGQIRDVFVYHKVYGVLKAEMGIKSRRDVRSYMEEISTGKSSLLKNVTSGYHYHTIDAESEEILDAIQEELQQKGFLAKLQDYEPVDFWGGQE